MSWKERVILLHVWNPTIYLIRYTYTKFIFLVYLIQEFWYDNKSQSTLTQWNQASVAIIKFIDMKRIIWNAYLKVLTRSLYVTLYSLNAKIVFETILPYRNKWSICSCKSYTHTFCISDCNCCTLGFLSMSDKDELVYFFQTCRKYHCNIFCR